MKDKCFKMRVSEEEQEEFKQIADQLGLSVAACIRYMFSKLKRELSLEDNKDK